jgi:hypothetical protein
VVYFHNPVDQILRINSDSFIHLIHSFIHSFSFICEKMIRRWRQQESKRKGGFPSLIAEPRVILFFAAYTYKQASRKTGAYCAKTPSAPVARLSLQSQGRGKDGDDDGTLPKCPVFRIMTICFVL